ncbi:Protein of unknown function DUF866 eukaryotic [Carpediemonas membranifera]|uniref:Uncharacterized protein n=1 Tax=Carpediemonas membranifera TaxID=201153 RepID=A0A8J6E6S9_9EUKA|nr:Protein of unknown function DUF866 eukaryotic [Carpediemonas membranifera]|eukprot:KAG9389875.1 Protein of unknown function DUF866 eukaryotic [Carpediemonas membranifera]
MGKQAFELKATLENVGSLVVSPDMPYNVQIKCSLCGEIHQKTVQLTEDHLEPIPPKNRSEAHFVMKCKGCGRVNSLSITKVTPYTQSESWQMVCELECRGFEVSEWYPRHFVGTGIEGAEEAKYEVELEDEEGWADYDERFDMPVSVLDLETRIV